MDFLHVSLVVKNLAKFHAFSLVAEKLYPEKFNDIKRALSKDVQYSDLNSIPNSLIWYFNASVSVITDPGRKPVEVVLVDYQLARFASPATDISYFLYMSANYDFLSKYYDQLLDIYYGTMAGILRQCDIDIQETFPRHILHDHLKEYSVLGLVEALISMKIVTAESEEAQKMLEMKHQVPNGLHEFETQNQIMFVERVNGIVKFFFERNFTLDGVIIEQ
ncbi:uncharacterized protein LOC119830958 [Zerene cesonia]|uniref:uncharacterized protein LOC119830958 n=1 Tax=Zerene cesonia TaxID=33412 RepID=UPI0018E57D3B|nr:uncharacterized protein LOC119830958 [Zerene cesonia]